MIRVLIVDDSSFMRKVVTQIISRDPEFNIVATAGDGGEALEKVISLKPDVVIMDIIMPLPDGIWALEEIMRQNPTPVVLFSMIGEAQSEIVEEAYALGVADVIQKPQNPQDMFKVAQELILKTKAAAAMRKSALIARLLPSTVTTCKAARTKAAGILVICSSAGGPVSLEEVLPKIPENFSLGIVVAQHMPHEFLTSYVEHLAKKCCFPIRMARNGDLIVQKRILFSPGNATLELARTKKGAVVSIVKPDVRLQPDFDIVLSTAAEVFKDKTICVILSGMGRYGVAGARAIKNAGGKVIGEDKSTASVYGMPEAVFSERLTDYVLPSYQITESIISMLAGKNPDAIDKEDFLVKGIIFNACVKYLKSTFGEQSAEHVTKSLPDAAQQILKGDYSPTMFYSGSSYIEFCQKAMEIYGLKRTKILEEIGASEARAVLELYRRSLFSKNDDPAHFMEMLPRIAASFFHGIKGSLTEFDIENRQGGFILRSRSFSRPVAARITQGRSAGWIKELAANSLGGKSVQVQCSTGSDAEGPFIKIGAKW